MNKTLVVAIASTFGAMNRCKVTGNTEWEAKHSDRLHKLMLLLPKGAGFDNGTRLDWEESKPDRLVFTTSFHHMDEHGGYDGWTDHKVIVTPSFETGLDLRVTGRNRDEIKDYIGDVFGELLMKEINHELATFLEV